MSKYQEDKDGNGTCPFCEKPLANYAMETEWDVRWLACGKDDEDPELNAWENQFCWYGWAQAGECRNGMSIEDRLIEVLDQRDILRAALVRINEIYPTPYIRGICREALDYKEKDERTAIS